MSFLSRAQLPSARAARLLQILQEDLLNLENPSKCFVLSKDLPIVWAIDPDFRAQFQTVVDELRQAGWVVDLEIARTAFNAPQLRMRWGISSEYVPLEDTEIPVFEEPVREPMSAFATGLKAGLAKGLALKDTVYVGSNVFTLTTGMDAEQIRDAIAEQIPAVANILPTSTQRPDGTKAWHFIGLDT